MILAAKIAMILRLDFKTRIFEGQNTNEKYFLNGGLSWKEAEPRVQKSIFWIVTVVVNGVGTVVIECTLIDHLSFF